MTPEITYIIAAAIPGTIALGFSLASFFRSLAAQRKNEELAVEVSRLKALLSEHTKYCANRISALEARAKPVDDRPRNSYRAGIVPYTGRPESINPSVIWNSPPARTNWEDGF